MKVYVLRWTVDYDDDEIIGVFSSEAAAIERARQDATAIGSTLDDGTRHGSVLRFNAGTTTHYTVCEFEIES